MSVFAKKHMSKKEQEELRKKQEEQAAAEVLEDFVSSFDNSGKSVAKMFVKGTVINPTSKEELAEKGTLYKPALKLIGKSTNVAKSLTPTPLPKMSAATHLVKKDKPAAKTADEAAIAALEASNKAAKAKAEKKSNLELFKEELKRIQLDREERHRKRQSEPDSKSKADEGSQQKDNVEPEAAKSVEKVDLNLEYDNHHANIPSGNAGRFQHPVSDLDPNTTNIFISNLSPKTVEQDLIQRFGKYGLLASVKIMWPRTDEEKARNANCGFVAFMTRRDAEIALRELDGIVLNGQTMRISWSKCITLPSQPIYIPPELVEVTIPPPPSGLPFNAQPQEKSKFKRTIKKLKKRIEKKKRRAPSNSTSTSSSSSSSSRSSSSSSSSSSSTSRSSDSSSQKRKSFSLNSSTNPPKKAPPLEETIVKVVLPTDRSLLCLIHRMIEFVVREGPTFEAIIMSREVNNPQFRFLFDNQSPAHSYYRWKLFSVLNGDSVCKWKTDLFQMFKNGSYWQPPPVNRYTQGSPDEAYEKVKDELQPNLPKKVPVPEAVAIIPAKSTPNKASEKLKKILDLIKNLTIERKSIAEVMVLCVENADKSEEICEYLKESIVELANDEDEKNLTLSLNKSLSRLYLMSDILHNCCVKVANVASYRRRIEIILPTVFESLNKMFNKIDGKMKSEWFKQKVLQCIKVWLHWNIYPDEFLNNLKGVFLELHNKVTVAPKTIGVISSYNSTSDSDSDDVDGIPLDE